MQATRRGPGIWFAISCLALASVLALLALLALSSRTPVWRLVALTIAAFAPYLSALWAAARMGPRLHASWPVVLLPLALRLILVPAPPVFSDDIHRYVWDGRVLASGTNPYRFSPDSPALEKLRNADWQAINHRSLRTIYPPLAELSFAALALVSPSILAFKLASVLADVAVVYLVILLAGGRLRAPLQTDDQQRCGRAALAGLAYGLNPLACVETGMSGHLEPLAVGLTLGALLLATRRRRLSASVVLGLGASVKLLPILLLPVVAGRRLRSYLAFALVVAALYLPFASAGAALFETLDAFGRRWEGNAGLFAVVKSGAQAAMVAIGGVDGPDGMLHLRFLDPLARALQNSFFSLHKDGAWDPAAPGAFTVQDLSLAAAKILLAGGLAAVIIRLARRRTEAVSAAVWILGGLVIATPVMHPWYLLWVLPVAAVRSVWPFFVLSVVLPLSYLPLDGWWRTGIWLAPAWVPWLEYALFAIAFAGYLASRRRE